MTQSNGQLRATDMTRHDPNLLFNFAIPSSLFYPQLFDSDTVNRIDVSQAFAQSRWRTRFFYFDCYATDLCDFILNLNKVF